MVLRVYRQGCSPLLTWPHETRLRYTIWTLSYPHLHRVQRAVPVQWDLLTGDPVGEIAAHLAQVAIKAHVGARRYREERFVNVSNLKHNPLGT